MEIENNLTFTIYIYKHTDLLAMRKIHYLVKHLDSNFILAVGIRRYLQFVSVPDKPSSK